RQRQFRSIHIRSLPRKDQQYRYPACGGSGIAVQPVHGSYRIRGDRSYPAERRSAGRRVDKYTGSPLHIVGGVAGEKGVKIAAERRTFVRASRVLIRSWSAEASGSAAAGFIASRARR